MHLFASHTMQTWFPHNTKPTQNYLRLDIRPEDELSLEHIPQYLNISQRTRHPLGRLSALALYAWSGSAIIKMKCNQKSQHLHSHKLTMIIWCIYLCGSRFAMQIYIYVLVWNQHYSESVVLLHNVPRIHLTYILWLSDVLCICGVPRLVASNYDQQVLPA